MPSCRCEIVTAPTSPRSRKGAQNTRRKRMKTRGLGITGLLAIGAALALSGCGGNGSSSSGGGKSLTKEEFAAKANAICANYLLKTSALGNTTNEAEACDSQRALLHSLPPRGLRPFPRARRCRWCNYLASTRWHRESTDDRDSSVSEPVFFHLSGGGQASPACERDLAARVEASLFGSNADSSSRSWRTPSRRASYRGS